MKRSQIALIRRVRNKPGRVPLMVARAFFAGNATKVKGEEKLDLACITFLRSQGFTLPVAAGIVFAINDEQKQKRMPR